MNKKKLTIIIVALVIGVIALAIGTSYALFTFNVTKGSIFKTLVGKLELSITDTINEDRIVINDLVPIKEEDALQESGYTFTVTNTGSIDAAYTVYLDDVVPQGESKGRIADNLMRANLTNSKSGKNYTFSLENNRILDTGILTSGESVTYTLRLWLDYSAGNEAQNKYFAARIRIDSVQSKGLALLKDIILEQNKVVTSAPTLTSTSEAANEKGLYKMSVTNGFGGQDGDTYYFRGNVTNNYVSFAGYTWRIVRINEDGTIRLIMQDGINNNATYAYSSDTSTVDAMYYTNSNAKNVLDTWYQDNILSKGFNDVVASGNYFCEQVKTKYSNSWTTGSVTAPVYTSYNPNLNCVTDDNNYGLVNSNIGLITNDEIIYGGAYVEVNNSDYYLKNGSAYWTMSTAGINAVNTSTSWRLGTTGNIVASSMANTYTLRPVINLKSTTKVTGNGTSSQPYVVVMNEDNNYQVSSALAAAISQFNPSDLKDVIMCDQSGDKYINCKIYNTMDAAITDRTTGTIIVTKDITKNGNFTIDFGKNYVIELNGKTINLSMFSMNGQLEVNDSTGTGKIVSASNTFNMGRNSRLVLRNITIETATNGVWISSGCTQGCTADIYDSRIVSANKGVGLHGSAVNSTINIYGNTLIDTAAGSFEIGGANNANIYGGTFVSHSSNALVSASTGTLNIIQTVTPIYITTLSQTYKPAIINSATGTINITANKANACTSNSYETTSGLCVYAEGDGDYSQINGNSAVRNAVAGTIDIDGGTYYASHQTINNNSTGTVTISNAEVLGKGYGVTATGSTGAGQIDINNSFIQVNNYRAVYNGNASTINITGGTYISDNETAIRNNTTGIINITQATEPVYITSLAKVWMPAINNNGDGTINIIANQANQCTSNANDTTSGLCVYAIGNGSVTTNDGNGALRNNTGITNITGGTFVSGRQGFNNQTGTINIDGAKIDSVISLENWGTGTTNIKNSIISGRAENGSTGTINMCSSTLTTGTGSDDLNNNQAAGTINYNNVTFSNGTTTPDPSKIYNPSGTITAVATCPISE